MNREKNQKGTFAGEKVLSNRTMYMANGFSEEDFDRPVIGIANAFSDVVPGHKNLRELAQQVKYGVYRAGGTPVEFGCIGVCDGICSPDMGPGYSLPSRDITADSIEIMVRAHKMDGLVLLGACDKTVPGMLMAAARLDIPCIFVAGGCMLSGPAFMEKTRADSTAVTEGYGMYQKGEISMDVLEQLAVASCPTAGSCQQMATANTMCCLAEVLGMSLPGTAAIPAVFNERLRAAFASGEAVVELVRRGISSRQIITQSALANAVRVLLAAGGSTNAVIHLCAIAHEISIDPSVILEMIDGYGDSTPLLLNINPSSMTYDMQDFYEAGGVPQLMKEMGTMLDLDCLTVTGKTVGENLDSWRAIYNRNYNVIGSPDKPFSTLPGLVIMRGNLALETAVAKPAAIAEEVRYFKGKAICFDSEEQCCEAIARQLVKAGDVVVIRYEGPKGAPGMPEMYTPSKLLYGQGLSKSTAVITDGRFSGTNNGCFVGHISPEAADGGTVALIRDGDEIEIDINNRRITLLVSDEELAKRKADFTYEPPEVSGYLKRYRDAVTDAAHGAVVK